MSLSGMKAAFLVLFFFMFSALSYAEEKIVEVNLRGNAYVETPAVMNKITTKAGDIFSRKQISRDVQKLFATGYFSDVYSEGEKVSGGLKLTFVVVENPVIASVKIEGNDEVADKKIKPEIKLKEGLVYSPRVELQTINKIRKIYLEKGYYQMTMNVKTTMRDDGRMDVVINIKEGEITFIKEIRFIGNHAFSDEVLIEALASRESDFASWFSSRDVFNQERFQADIHLLQQFYQDRGYLDAKVESIRLMLSPDKEGFYMALSIHEGPQFRISGIELQGDIIPSKEALMEVVKLQKGDLYSVTKLRHTIDALIEKVGDEGFAFASATPLFHRNIENNTLVVSFDIEKGREVYIERIEISGHTKTKDYVMRREFRQHEGERYSASKVKRSKERLNRLNYIKKVNFSTAEGSSKDKLVGKLEVEEGKSGSFRAGVTYSQLNNLAFTGTVEEQNLFGEGYRANVTADMGGQTNNYSVNLVDPYFMSEDVSLSASAFKSQSDLQSTVQYKTDSKGGTLGLGVALSEYVRYSVSYNQTSSTVSGVPTTASFALRSQEGTNITGELQQSLSYDTRDRLMSTTDGGLQRVTVGYAGLTGEHKFYEVIFNSNNYYPLSDFWTVRLSGTASMVRGYSGMITPIFRRYSLGGAGNLRGYESYGVSIVDPVTKDILGANYKALGSLDLIFPMPYMEAAGIRGDFFVDAGTVCGGRAAGVAEPFDRNKIRGAYGFGIEWASPVGPITMSWSNAVNAQPDDKTRKFEFTLGRGF